MLNIPWTTEQIWGLAPDPYSLKTGRSFAFTERWAGLGHNQHTAWGEFPIKDKPSFQTAVHLSTLAASCSCISRKLPCSHTLSLLLLLTEQPAAFSELPPPAWVTTWQNQPQGQKHPYAATPGSQENYDQKRLATLRAGLQELELWLQDLVRTGFATAQGKPKNYWSEMAERLVDAQAGEVAGEVRRLVAIPGSGEGWPERLLQKIGRLFLLIQGFTRFETLPPEMQADLQLAVGWLPRPPTLEAARPVRDKWHILGRQLEQSGKQKIQRLWLWGEQTNQPALLLHIAHRGQVVDTSLLPGTLLEADLGFYPSAAPLRAHLLTRHDLCQPRQQNFGYPTIKNAMRVYAQAITANPWLPYFPLALHAVTAASLQKEWIVCDQSGYLLPLPPKYEYGWHLRALGREGHLSLFGIWDGQYLHPLSLWREGWWGEPHTWGGVK